MLSRLPKSNSVATDVGIHGGQAIWFPCVRRRGVACLVAPLFMMVPQAPPCCTTVSIGAVVPLASVGSYSPKATIHHLNQYRSWPSD